MQRYFCQPGSVIRGELSVPGDKSVSHRSLMLGGIATGTTEVSGFLESEDCLATMAALRAMGVNIARHGGNRVTVHGVGIDGLKAPPGPLDMGNAGTADLTAANIAFTWHEVTGQHALIRDEGPRYDADLARQCMMLGIELMRRKLR